MDNYYAGIGARNAPYYILFLAMAIGKFLAKAGWGLRSGAADGMDAAFERGCNAGGGQKQIFLPWAGYNNSDSALVLDKNPLRDAAVQKVAALVGEHRSKGMKESHVKLLARNVFQILGADLCSPSRFVLGYTCNGENVGGTGFSLRLAEQEGITCLNLHNAQEASKLLAKMGMAYTHHDLQFPEEPADGEVFVFASNSAGLHNSGSAKFAWEKRGAVYGEGDGPTGKAYGVVLKSQGQDGATKLVGRKSAQVALRDLCMHARRNPEKWFLIGFTQEELGLNDAQFDIFLEILLAESPPSNIVFPKDVWKKIIAK